MSTDGDRWIRDGFQSFPPVLTPEQVLEIRMARRFATVYVTSVRQRELMGPAAVAAAFATLLAALAREEHGVIAWWKDPRGERK